jgi:uncharacterized membrane protein YfcA
MSALVIYGAYLLIGVIAGLLGGLLGIGGGVVTVPCLLVLFHTINGFQGDLMHTAIATSLAAMIFNTAAATWAHNKKGNVVWTVFRKLVPGLVIGSILGAVIATLLSGTYLEIFFGIFLILLAVYFYRQKAISVGEHQLPHPLVLNSLSGSIGILSNLLGIGGGSMTVPLLTAFKMKDRNAIGTSAATTLVTTTFGTLTYLVPKGENSTLGLISVPAFLIVGLASFFTAPYGARLTRKIDPGIVRKIFAIVLLLTGLSLVF